MIVKNRKGDWVLRVYSQNSDGTWSVGTESFYPTRALMRNQAKVWRKVARGVKFKIKTYRIHLSLTGVSEAVGFYNTTMYVETR